MDLAHKIRNSINRYEMLEKGERVLVAVSGGPDSVFLLYILNRIKDTLGIKLYVAHLDHSLRGRESQGDALFVKKLSDKLGIKVVRSKLSKRKSKSKLSLEEILREKRYEFFKKAARKLRVGTVATAHTLDDQAETVLMRLIKGASLKGVVGIHPVRIDKDIKFVRPLIETEKKDILKYLKEKKVPFRTDRTNLEDKFLRNRVRNKVLPYLAKINPRIKRSLFNVAESLREDFEFIEKEKRKTRRLIKTKKSDRHILLRDILLQPKALQKEIIREAMLSIGGNIKKLSFRHWKDIDLFVRRTEKGKSLDLPGRVRIRKTHDSLIFTR